MVDRIALINDAEEFAKQKARAKYGDMAPRLESAVTCGVLRHALTQALNKLSDEDAAHVMRLLRSEDRRAA